MEVKNLTTDNIYQLLDHRLIKSKKVTEQDSANYIVLVSAKYFHFRPNFDY